jgi:hypothetical protein
VDVIRTFDRGQGRGCKMHDARYRLQITMYRGQGGLMYN